VTTRPQVRNRAEAELDNFALDPSCVLYLPLWKLDGDSFMSKDAYGQLCTNHGSLWTPQGRKFDGVDDYITAANALPISTTDDFTVSVLVNLKADAVRDMFGYYGDSNNLFLQLLADGAVRFRYKGTEASPGTQIDTSSGVISSDTFYWITATKVAGDIASLFINSSAPLTTPDMQESNITGVPEIGGIASLTFHCKGLVNEVRIYSRALTPQEIQHHYIVSKELFA